MVLFLDFGKKGSDSKLDDGYSDNIKDWKLFLNKYVKVIRVDHPRENIVSKEGILIGFTNTHLIIEVYGKPEALPLIDIKRVYCVEGKG